MPLVIAADKEVALPLAVPMSAGAAINALGRRLCGRRPSREVEIGCS